jgi:hypothetical protein
MVTSLIQLSSFFMKTLLLGAALLFSSALAHAQTAPATLYTQAMSAYQAKDYAKAAPLFDQDLRSKRVPTASNYYDVACAWALAGNAGKAFGYLKQATAAGFEDVEHLQTDTDLTSLRKDRRWQPLVASLKAKVAKEEAHVNQALKQELAAMHRTDQGIRLKMDSVENKLGMDALIASPLAVEMREADKRNQARLVAIINQYGWPGRTLVGKAGATTAFLVVQHADPEMQQQYLPLIQKAAAQGELEKSAAALLQDRVLIGQGKPQIYGSQLTSNMDTRKYEFYPIEDEAHVDERRATVGLGPLAEYAKHFGLEYTPKK